jgi:hypothetical protein
MNNPTPEFHGNEDQQRIMKKADDLWRLVRDDTRYCCHGRAVALADYSPSNTDLQISLARLQGVGACNSIPADAIENRRAELENAGLIVDQYETWRGETKVLDMANAVLNSRNLAEDLEMHLTNLDTPSSDMAELNTLAQSCDVLLPIGWFMRGVTQPAACVYAKDRNGNIFHRHTNGKRGHPCN